MRTSNFKFCFFCFLLISLQSNAQWNDSFDDANLNANPAWLGQISNFEVNPNLQLQLNAPAEAGQSYLVTESKLVSDVTWKFYIQLDLNSSSSNYAKVFLVSDKSNLGNSLCGYYLRIGGDDDDISLFRQDGLKTHLIVDGRDGMLDASVNKLSVQVTHTLQGLWTVSCDSTGKSDFSTLGSCMDNTYSSSGYFGVQCIFTSSRSNKFFFDNFEVINKVIADKVSPVVREVKPLADSSVFIGFSEDINAASLKNVSHFRPAGNVVQKLQVQNSRSVVLFLSQPIFCKQKEEIAISGITDLAGNKISDTTLFVSYCPGVLHDVLITEIMADPDPQVYLPKVEYVELLNKSGGDVNLDKWILTVGDERITLPDVLLPADSFLLICSSGGCSSSTTENCLEALPYGCLNNGGDYIGLKNMKGELIHWVTYDESFYQDELKANGGWSLEMIDTDNPCCEMGNWIASKDTRGGSPGKTNSVAGTITDNGVFRYDHVFLPDDSTVRLYFSKPVDTRSISPRMFSLDNEYPLKLITDSIRHQYIDLIFKETFQANSTYVLHFSDDIPDCSGKTITGISAVTFMKPSEVASQDVIINEVLFDALPGGEEFIEFYNNSNKYIKSSDLRFAYRNISSEYESALEFGAYPFLIAPNAFVVAVKRAYNMEKLYPIRDMSSVVEIKSFPVLNNAEGCVRLMNKSLEVTDEFCYSENMHFNLLGNKSGVSLERIRYGNPASDPGNWHSASSTEGFATPGAINSQWLEENETENEIALEYEIFSPDNDGYNDVETIFYHFDQPGFVANIIVFDASGRRVKLISNNQLLGTQGSLTWDGIDEDGRLASTGIYLVYVELHHPSGITRQYRKTCVLAGGKNR